MKKLRLWLALATCCTVKMAHSQHSLSGFVYDENERPLPHVNLLLEPAGKTTYTDAKGYYKFDNLEKKAYTVFATSVGYDSVRQEVSINGVTALTITMLSRAYIQNEFIVRATRAGNKSPLAFQNIGRVELNKNNLGQDLPILLNGTPSSVTTSDAGAGVGYTGIRIRGSDATRINVTVNGVPLNDAESQGVYWVNMPDFVSSLNSVQIQRGVGTSTNGAGAFGASINLQSTSTDTSAFTEFNNAYGSFNTQKNTLKWGTGVISKYWRFNGRVSRIASDGYIDRASSDLQSFYLSAKFARKNTAVEALSFGGREKTYQSWYGTPESRVKGDTTAMLRHAQNNNYTPEQTSNLLNAGRTYNYYLYKNETDNYWQNHYQLHGYHRFSNRWTGNGALHYTRGKGYYEQLKSGQSFASYGVPDVILGGDTFTSSSLVRQLWLDNHFYGATASLLGRLGTVNLVAGGGWNVYRGRHFGRVIWAELAQNFPVDYRFYLNHSYKRDANAYIKADYLLTNSINLYGDIQFRHIYYYGHGSAAEGATVDFSASYAFINPKAGIYYTLNKRNQLYTSVSIANREPVRTDFVDNKPGTVPRAEHLTDFEAGYKYQSPKLSAGINAYFMNYKNQLVVTGELNNVGSSLRKNVDKSYRAGLELMASAILASNLKWEGNLTLSNNRIREFKETVYNYDSSTVEVNTYNNVYIAMSPGVIGYSAFTYTYHAASICLMTKYVGRQYLDNTAKSDRSLSSYMTNDLRLAYSPLVNGVRKLQFTLLVNNLLGAMYSSNGYTYSYIYGGSLITENFYYPQAPASFLAGVSIAF